MLRPFILAGVTQEVNNTVDTVHHGIVINCLNKLQLQKDFYHQMLLSYF